MDPMGAGCAPRISRRTATWLNQGKSAVRFWHRIISPESGLETLLSRSAAACATPRLPRGELLASTEADIHHWVSDSHLESSGGIVISGS